MEIESDTSSDYTLSATGLVTTTFSLWTRNLVKYIIIVGVIGAAYVATSFALLLLFFNLIGTIGADPISYLLSFFFVTLSEPALIAVSVGFAFFAFILNAIIYGAAIKFTLDEYGGNGGDVGTSFSRSIRRILDIIIVQLIISFIIAIVLTPATILTTRAMEMIDLTDPLNPIFSLGSIELLMQGFALLIVGGIFVIYFMIRFAPTLAIVIDTDLSAIDSLKRSWELTSGNFLHVFGGYILLRLVLVVLGFIISMALAFTLLPTALLVVIGSVITALLFGALDYIFIAVLYRNLGSRIGTSSLEELML